MKTRLVMCQGTLFQAALEADASPSPQLRLVTHSSPPASAAAPFSLQHRRVTHADPPGPTRQTRRAVTELPEYGAKLRRRARENVPHNHDRLFSSFSAWVEVRFQTLEVRSAAPKRQSGLCSRSDLDSCAGRQGRVAI